MGASKIMSGKASHVIIDLDGTLLNTDGIVIEILRGLVVKYGKKWDDEVTRKVVGKTLLEAATVAVEDHELPCKIDDFVSAITPIINDRWCNIKALPGANRLINHLKSKGVPIALASNSPRSNIETKISYQNGWMESFAVIIGGDEVKNGKPSPEIFLAAANGLNTDPSNCLVIEDSLPGVAAGKAAKMNVIAVPSLPQQASLYSSADEVINSLLDLHLENWGLPPFEDWVEDTLQIEPLYIGGPVIKGFHRGSKVLGIPTANLSAENFSDVLAEHTSGVYFGWAGLSTRGIFKMVTSIGWNPFFKNTKKTIEPWILHKFDDVFYGEELRLVIVGYIRPMTDDVVSINSLIERIHEDGRIAEKALDLPLYANYRNSAYLANSLQQNNNR